MSDIETTRVHNEQGVLVHQHSMRHNTLHGPSLDYSPEGKLIKSEHYQEGALHGPYLLYSDDGAQLLEEGHYEHGKRHGLFRWYFRSSQIAHEPHVQEERTYAHDQPEAEWREFFDNGDLRCVVTYQNGRLDGPRRYFRKYGELEWEELLRPDPHDSSVSLREGVYREYHDNGALKVYGEYQAGMRHGVYRTYHENGRLSEEYFYRHDQLDPTAVHRTFYVTGILKSESCRGEGVDQGYEEAYYPDGSLIFRRGFKNTDSDGVWERYDTSGRCVWKQTYQDGLLSGEERTYFDEGMLESLVEWKMGRKLREVHYYRNGNLRSEEDHDPELVRFKTYAPGGGLLVEGGYLPNRRDPPCYQGPMTRYGENGDVTDIVYWANGKLYVKSELK